MNEKLMWQVCLNTKIVCVCVCVHAFLCVTVHGRLCVSSDLSDCGGHLMRRIWCAQTKEPSH